MHSKHPGRPHCARWFTALLCAGVLANPSPALGQDSSADELARRHFDSGVAYLHESDYESALKEFQRAFELSGRPAILVNIATVHERTSNLDAAISALQQYLALDPEGEHAETVRVRIANLEKRRNEQQPAQQAPADSAPAAAQPAPTPAAAGSEPAPTPSVRSEPLPPPEPEPEPDVPAYVLLGIGAVSAVAAAVTGYFADDEWHKAQDACSPNCTDAELSTGRKMAWTSTILTGVALAGVGVGAGLLLLGNREDETPAMGRSMPELTVGVASHGGSARATWRF
jgi:tetratricopeptide (TPR) repeat protein